MADGILIGDLPNAAALTPASDFTYLEQPSQSTQARKVTVANLLAPALKGPYFIYTVDTGSGSTLGLSMETGQHMSVRFSGTAAFTTVQVPDGAYVGQIVAITNDRAINLTVVAETPSTLHKTIVLGNGDSCTLTWEGSGSWRADATPAPSIVNYALSDGGDGDGLDLVSNNNLVTVLNLTGGATYPTPAWIGFFTMTGVPVGGLILVQNRSANAITVKSSAPGLSLSREVSCGPGNAILLERAGATTLNAYAFDDSAWRDSLAQPVVASLTTTAFARNAGGSGVARPTTSGEFRIAKTGVKAYSVQFQLFFGGASTAASAGSQVAEWVVPIPTAAGSLTKEFLDALGTTNAFLVGIASYTNNDVSSAEDKGFPCPYTVKGLGGGNLLISTHSGFFWQASAYIKPLILAGTVVLP